MRAVVVLKYFCVVRGGGNSTCGGCGSYCFVAGAEEPMI